MLPKIPNYISTNSRYYFNKKLHTKQNSNPPNYLPQEALFIFKRRKFFPFSCPQRIFITPAEMSDLNSYV